MIFHVNEKKVHLKFWPVPHSQMFLSSAFYIQVCDPFWANFCERCKVFCFFFFFCLWCTIVPAQVNKVFRLIDYKLGLELEGKYFCLIILCALQNCMVEMIEKWLETIVQYTLCWDWFLDIVHNSFTSSSFRFFVTMAKSVQSNIIKFF
jgi:hypothetical protein